jgi:NADH-quinone oxidoreductase subunit F
MLLSLSDEISGKVLCALGDFAVNPVVATVNQFRDEYLDHLRLGKCPFGSWAL